MGFAAPPEMRALVLSSFEGDLPRPQLVERPLPKLRAGEVLVRVAAAPINPNDILFLRDRYDVKKPLPVVPGFEGSGTVVASGGGLMARAMVGRHVAFAAGEGDGSWAEFAAVPAMRCAPLRGATTPEEGATMLTNPLTAWVLASEARREGHRAVVLTAAAGALGVMLGRLLRHQGRVVIAVVRRPAQVATLRNAGIDHVLDSSAEGFDQRLRTLAAEHAATLALDAVGGEMTGRLFDALPPGGIVRVYGMLADAPARVDPSELVFRSKRLEGFTMYEWLRATSLPAQLYALSKVQGLLSTVLRTSVKSRLALEAIDEALTLATTDATGGKVLLVP